jgi:maltooligosyltrehalose trehalohydrolase
MKPLNFASPPGATYLGDGRCHFQLWAPLLQSVELRLLDDGRNLPMTRDERGYWHVTVADVSPGARYRYWVDADRERPDPASRHQPEGVHGPSAVVDPAFAWSDHGWHGIPLADYVIYELHVGTFTDAGTFEAIIPHLAELKRIGITAIELMPIAEFPGSRNWGYDGVYLYAPHRAYGGVQGLKRLVDAAHNTGLAVILDVVYNHFGPEGNYLYDLARPFFTDRYHTPWGDAVNVDGEQSDPVRHFIIANALYWLREFHIDALRLDAVHAIYDNSAYHLLEEMADAAHAQAERLNRRAYLIAETDQNDPRMIRSPLLGGYGLDGQWADDLHHAIHTLLTGESAGYYQGYGTVEQLAHALRRALVFAGAYAPSRGHRVGRRPTTTQGAQYVVCTQNHDQVGNRAMGDRLTTLIDFSALKLAAATMLLSPYLPLIFMGEEYAEPNPFQYFTEHGDPALVHGVREGRKEEFAAFLTADQVLPDPQDPATFARSKLNHALRTQGRHAVMQHFYATLLRLRRELPALRTLALDQQIVTAHPAQHSVTVERWTDAHRVWIGLNYSNEPVELLVPAGSWTLVLDSAAAQWHDPSAPPAPPPSRKDVLQLTVATPLALNPHSAVLLQQHT